MTKEVPSEGTVEYVDYLLEGLEGEIRLSERYDLRLDSIAFYKTMLRAAYQQTRERKEAEYKVVIEVLGGVAHVTCSPDEIDVEIIDHDNEEPSAFAEFLEQADMPQAGDARDEA
jgi:hypothetical protein